MDDPINDGTRTNADPEGPVPGWQKPEPLAPPLGGRAMLLLKAILILALVGILVSFAGGCLYAWATA